VSRLDELTPFQRTLYDRMPHPPPDWPADEAWKIAVLWDERSDGTLWFKLWCPSSGESEPEEWEQVP
jgi:hypothetical protein